MDIEMVIANVEDYTYQGEVKGRTVFGEDGNEQRVKGGSQGKKLWERWAELDAGIGKTVVFKMGMFKDKPYVADFAWKEGEAKPLTEQPKSTPKPEPGPTTQPKKHDQTQKSICLSYAERLAETKIIGTDKILPYAEAFYQYCVGGIKVTDEATFKAMCGKFFELEREI